MAMVALDEDVILVFRTRHHPRRLALGPWSNQPPSAVEGEARLDVDASAWVDERRVAAWQRARCVRSA